MGNFPCVGKMKKLFFQFSNFSYIFSNVVASPDKKHSIKEGAAQVPVPFLGLHGGMQYKRIFFFSRCLAASVCKAQCSTQCSAIVAFDNGGLTSRIHQRSLLYIFLFSFAPTLCDALK